MQQQLARTDRVVLLEPDRVLPRRDVHVPQPDLAPVDLRVAVGEVRTAGAHRLDLGAGERDAGLDRPVDRVVEAGLAVVGEDPLARSGVVFGRGLRRMLTVGVRAAARLGGSLGGHDLGEPRRDEKGGGIAAAASSLGLAKTR